MPNDYNNIQKFHAALDEKHASFPEFLRAVLSVFPYAEVHEDSGNLTISTALEYVENSTGNWVVQLKVA